MKKLLLLFVLICAHAQAQDDSRAILRSHIEPSGPVLVGQPVRLYVDVLVTTWFTGAPEYPQLELEGALVILLDERPANLTERIEGQTWFGMSRSYLIYPQEPREYRTPIGDVVVHYGQADQPARLAMNRHTFRARIPDEARGLGYFIATTGFRMEQKLDPQPKGLKTGDSLRRTITMSADKTLAMFLPPVQFESKEGLTLYPDPPKLEDRTKDRQGFQDGRRIDGATYVIQKEGTYILSPVEVFWWDLTANRMRRATAPSVEFQADPNPEFAPEIPIPVEEDEAEVAASIEDGTWWDIVRKWSVPAVAALALLLVLVRYLPGLISRTQLQIAERRMRYENSEAYAFAQLCDASRSSNSRDFIARLYRWLDRITPSGQIATLRGFAAQRVENEIDRDLDFINAELFKSGTLAGRHQWDKNIYEILARMRKRATHKHQEKERQRATLPELNPRGSGRK